MQKLGLEWACKRFCIGEKLKVCNVLLWVWRSNTWMNEKECYLCWMDFFVVVRCYREENAE